MPRLGNRVPSYRKHRQSGQAIVTLNGRDHLLGPHGTKASKREYDRLISEWLVNGRTAPADPEAVTIAELIVAYLRHAKSYYGDGPNSELHRITRVVRPLKELYARTAATEFGVLQFKTVRQRLLDEGLSRSNINAMMKRIARLFRWAASEGRISPAIPQALAMVPGLRRGKTTALESAPVLPVDDTLVEATLPHLSSIIGDMVRFQRLTGCRPAEVCLVRPCDIDRSNEVWEYRPESHKTQYRGKDRVIFIGPQAQDILLRYLARDAQAYCFSPRDAEAKRRAALSASRKTPLSCGNKPGMNRKRKPRRQPGERYDSRSYHQAVRIGCRKAFPVPAEIEDDPQAVVAWWKQHQWAPNRLRHSAATEIRKRFGLEHAQIVLGHSQANITQIYAERDAAKGIEVARLIG